MQWSPDRNGGFSRANPASLVLPAIMDPLYGFEAVNVESQDADPHSMLNWMRRMLAVRSQHRSFGRGKLRTLTPVNRKVLAYLREVQDDAGQVETILCVANVSRSAQPVELELSEFSGRVPVEMIGGSLFPAIGPSAYILTLPPYGFFWFTLAAQAQLPAWHVPAPEAMPDYVTLVVRKGIDELIVGRTRVQLENDILPNYLQKRRWFGQKDGKPPRARIALATRLPRDGRPLLLVEIETHAARGSAGSDRAAERAVDRYLLPFGFFGEDESVSALPMQLALARVRRGRQVGYLTDAFALADFAHHIVHLLTERAHVSSDEGVVHFVPTVLLYELLPQLEATAGAGTGVRWLSAEQTNSSLVIGDTAVLKVVRRIAAGVNPEAEITRVLSQRGYANASSLLGEVTRVGTDGTPHLLIVLQRYIHNQGDAWQWTLNVLERVFQQTTVSLPALATTARPDEAVATDAGDTSREKFEELEAAALAELEVGATVLGRRLGEMHAVLGQACDDPAFAPRRVDTAMAANWGEAAVRQIVAALDVLVERLRDDDAAWSAAERGVATDLVNRRAAFTHAAMKLARLGVGSLATRIHGDFHLGQVLVTQGDAVIIDFEGEPVKTLAERRAKMSPLRDVAGLLRSIDYAAAMSLQSGPADVGEAGEAKKRDIVARYMPAAKKAFLVAYRAEAKRIEHRWDHEDGEAALLDLFTIEKAAYELCYEAANRPTWIGVPLAGLAELAQALLSPRPSAERT